MRTVLIGFVSVLLVLSCGLAIRYSQDASFAQEQLNGERYKRLVSEENFQKARAEVVSLKAELKRAQDKIGQIEGLLEKTKAYTDDLRSRLDKAAEIKGSLDRKIKELQMLVSPM